jgi:hypothetical protein
MHGLLCKGLGEKNNNVYYYRNNGVKSTKDGNISILLKLSRTIMYYNSQVIKALFCLRELHPPLTPPPFPATPGLVSHIYFIQTVLLH